MKPGRGFEWFVAWRHLRDPERRGRRALVAGIAIVALGLVALGVSLWLEHLNASPPGFLRTRPPIAVEYLRNGGISALILGVFITYLGILFATFTVFTAISIFGVFLGTFAPIVALSVMSGFETDLKSKIRGSKADVVTTPKDAESFSNTEQIRARIADVPGIVASTAYIETEVMLNTPTAPAGVILRGIDPRTAGKVLDLEGTLREGSIRDLAEPARVKPARPPSRPSFFPEGDEDLAAPDRPVAKAPADQAEAETAGPEAKVLPTILLGEELYGKNLSVFLGSEIQVVCPQCRLGPMGAAPKQKSFRVAGHFYSGMYEFDSKLAYISLAAAQEFLEMPGEVSGIDVRAANPDAAGQVAAAVQRVLGDDYDVRSWQELNRGLFMALRLEKIAMFIVLTFIALVASFSIVSNLIMMVTEKGREVAILKAMGASDGAILRVFVAEGLYIGLLGLAVGVTFGVIACHLIQNFGLPLPTDVYYISQLPVVMRAGEIVTVAAIALLLCCLATIYPAVLASRLRPVEGLRYE